MQLDEDRTDQRFLSVPISFFELTHCKQVKSVGHVISGKNKSSTFCRVVQGPHLPQLHLL